VTVLTIVAIGLATSCAMAVALYRSGFRRFTWLALAATVGAISLPPLLFFVFQLPLVWVLASFIASLLAGLGLTITGLKVYGYPALGIFIGWVPMLTWPVFMYLAVTGHSSCEHMQFQRFLTADRVEINNNMGKPIMKDITSPEHIEKLARFAISYENKKWIAPNLGVPGAKVRAEFHKGETFLGDFGYEPTFFAAQGCGYFYIHRAKPEETQAFARLLSDSSR
jgi:hypothetical protein